MLKKKYILIGWNKLVERLEEVSCNVSKYLRELKSAAGLFLISTQWSKFTETKAIIITISIPAYLLFFSFYKLRPIAIAMCMFNSLCYISFKNGKKSPQLSNIFNLFFVSWSFKLGFYININISGENHASRDSLQRFFCWEKKLNSARVTKIFVRI